MCLIKANHTHSISRGAAPAVEEEVANRIWYLPNAGSGRHDVNTNFRDRCSIIVAIPDEKWR